LERTRDFGIESLRWIAIVAVVMHHGVFRQRQSPETVEQIMRLKEWIEWCVPAFFYLSGLLFRSGTSALSASYLATRAKRLLVPYAIVSTLAFAALLALHHSGIWSYPRPEELRLGHFFRLTAWLVGFGPQFYFLPYLFLVGLAAALLAWKVPARWMSTVAAALFALCGFGWLMPETVLGPGLERVPAFLLAFALGVSDRGWTGKGRHVHFAGALLVLGGIGLGLGTWWPVSIWIPLALYRILGLLPARRVIEALDRVGNPGAIFLWHAPILLPAASFLLGRLGVLDWSNYLLSVSVACLGALAVDSIIRKIPVLRLARL